MRGGFNESRISIFTGRCSKRGDEKKNMTKEIPRCHGEPMTPIYRYKDRGVIYVTYGCNFPKCSHKVEVEQ